MTFKSLGCDKESLSHSSSLSVSPRRQQPLEKKKHTVRAFFFNGRDAEEDTRILNESPSVFVSIMFLSALIKHGHTD